MKLTKTIAAVAAVALTVSAMSLAALAEECTGDHTYGEWETTKNATCGEAGSKKHTCTVDDCGHSETAEIPATGEHNFGDDGTAEKCSVCNAANPNAGQGGGGTTEGGNTEGGNTEGGNTEGGSTGGASSGATLTEVNTAIDEIAAKWDYSWVPVSELESWGANEAINNVKNELKRAFDLTADLSLISYTVGENGKVTFTVKVNVGGEEVTRDVTLQCKNDVADVGGGDDDNNNDNNDNNNNDTTVSEPAYTPPASSSSSAEVAEQVAESPKDVTSSRKPDITVNAAESGVSADIVAAFTSNKSAKTLTLKYSSTLKVAIAKEDISDAAAKLDFSVSGEKFLSSKQVKKLGAEKVVQLDFVSTGKLDGVDKATIKSSVGMGYVGKTVTVYEMVNGKLVKVGVAKVNGAGIVKFDTDHLGQFVLAVK